MSDAHSSNFNGHMQCGFSADKVLADAYIKSVRDVVDRDDGVFGIQTKAEATPLLNVVDLRNLEASTK